MLGAASYENLRTIVMTTFPIGLVLGKVGFLSSPTNKYEPPTPHTANPKTKKNISRRGNSSEQGFRNTFTLELFKH